MDNDNLLIICRSCGRKTLMHNMREDTDKENMICIDCYKKKAPASKSTLGIFGKKIVENSPYDSPAAKKEKAPIKERMIKYICTNCKYKFSRKESQQVEKCPYCGKMTIIQDNALGAEKILKESTDKRFEKW